MKTILENWNKFVSIEEVEVPPEIEQSDQNASKTINKAEDEADNVAKKIMDASPDEDVRRQSLETIIRKLVDFYKGLTN
jgi:hypothetical protein